MRLKRHRFGMLLVSMFLACFASHASGQAKTGDVVAGKVLSASDGHPLAHAAVSLMETGSRRKIDTLYTGEDGDFRFEAVPAGRYSLLAQARGFVQSLYLQHEDLFTDVVTGADLDTSALLLTLTPSAEISGRILDDTGEPVERPNVMLYREQPDGEHRIVRVRNSFLNNQDEFEFDDLAPGRYFLSVTAEPWYAVHPAPEPTAGVRGYKTSVDPALDAAYPMTFYPAATQDTDASPIELKPGDAVSADIHLTAVHALSITLPFPESSPGRPPQPFGYTLMRTVFGNEEPTPTPMTVFNGVAHIFGLTPGTYELRSQGLDSHSFGSVTLTSESSVTEAPTPVHGAAVHVIVHTLDGAAPTKNVSIALTARGSSNSRVSLSRQLAGKDSIDFSDVPSGEFRFAVYGGVNSSNVARVVVNGAESPAKVLRINGTGEIKVDLTLGGRPTSITGSAHRPDGKLSVPSMVVLVPAGKDTSPDLFRRDQTGLDGRFTLHNVLPGDYLLLALEDAWEIRWKDPAALTAYLPHAAPIQVPANGPTSIRLNEPVVSQTR